MNTPEFLILDEPTNGLDPAGIVEIRNLLKALNKEYGMTILVSSHILEELHQTASEFILIDKGKIIEEISNHELKNLSPKIDLPRNSVYLHSDFSMVERILQNLLTNAIHYSSGNIRMVLRQSGENKAIFTIENPVDSKLEINPNRLFERFYKGDKSRHNGGTGVGLAVVKLLTDTLGGNVSATVLYNVLTVKLEIQ